MPLPSLKILLWEASYCRFTFPSAFVEADVLRSSGHSLGFPLNFGKSLGGAELERSGLNVDICI